MSKTEHPNVIFIIADQMKWSALRMYSDIGIETPSLERLASEGVRVETGITPHALCVPARVSMMTSRFAHSTGARRNETLMPAGVTHAFGVWKSAGYTTGLIGKNHCFDREEDIDLLDVHCELWHRGLQNDAPLKGMEWSRPQADIHAAEAVRANMPRQSPRIS